MRVNARQSHYAMRRGFGLAQRLDPQFELREARLSLSMGWRDTSHSPREIPADGRVNEMYRSRLPSFIEDQAQVLESQKG
ncbi:hypothetical protein FA13DRAFT_1741685 [Coprinellus micaceus]|uniref:Uncharacterized protein n=1 Tax=Coprinellus micaceus TaxID=71717 RepID=A0A4Y7SJ04_COPMI|nr:hypothetical protein FA13DRAFT_1741685 [Coprinellus micaceus]